jgi:predicted DNA-binding transcriptional regulator AlpA
VFLTYNDLQALGVGIPRRPHLRRLIKAGYFPAPYQLTPNRIIWRQSEIRRWMETRPVAASAA